jgi:hypothetical protein
MDRYAGERWSGGLVLCVTARVDNPDDVAPITALFGSAWPSIPPARLSWWSDFSSGQVRRVSGLGVALQTGLNKLLPPDPGRIFARVDDQVDTQVEPATR